MMILVINSFINLIINRFLKSNFKFIHIKDLIKDNVVLKKDEDDAWFLHIFHKNQNLYLKNNYILNIIPY